MLRPHDPIPGRTLRAVGELTSAISKFPDLESISITGVSIDSHQIEAGDLFVAVAGAKVHGATYAGNAKLNGAVAVLTDEVGAGLITDLPVLVVSDWNQRQNNCHHSALPDRHGNWPGKWIDRNCRDSNRQ
jgi:UDP-N-acetylmuramoyl-L-alanyl-D-glutamate--2,6-diaminopimelate ligase